MADDLTTLVGLLERWRDAGTVERVRVGVDAARLVRGLPAERKRALALEVASRVAPQLVPQIEAETGDLTPEQVGAVVDLLRRADRDQLDSLVTALRTGDVDPALALVDEALDAVGVEDTLPPPPRDADGDGVPDELEDEAAEGIAEVEADARRRMEELPDEQELREQVEEQAEAAGNRWRDTSPAPATMAPIDFDHDVTFDLDALEMPDTTVEQMAPLEERLDQLPGRAAATRQVPEPASPTPVAHLRPPPVTEALARVTATPDGYRRRRAALAALREGVLDAAEVVEVVRGMDRQTDRWWVAGAAIDAGVLGSDHVADLPVSQPARTRLAARLG